MTKVQAASVISRLPVIPFLGKKEKVKLETKQEMSTMESTSGVPPVPEMSQTSEVPPVPEMSRTTEAPRVPEPQVTPTTTKRAEAEEIDLERDAEVSG